MSGRVTSAQVEALITDNASARVSAIQVEVLLPDLPAESFYVTTAALQVVHNDVAPADLTMSQEGVEVIADDGGALQVTQEGVEAIAGGDFGGAEVTQMGAEVIWRGAIFTGCEEGLPYFRVRVRLPDEEDDLAVFTSLPSGPNSVLIEPPKIDPSTCDVLRGKTTVGGCTVTLSDPDAGTIIAPEPTVRAFTQWLANLDARLQLLGARLFIDATENPDPDEVDWSAYWAGYIAGIRYPDAITVEITGAHTTRDDETTMVFTQPSAWFPNTGCLAGGPIPAGPLGAFPSADSRYTATRFQGAWYAKVVAVYDTFVELDINEDQSAANNGPFPPIDVKPFLKDRGLFVSSNNDFQRNVFKWLRRNVQPYYVDGGPTPDVAADWAAHGTNGWYPRLYVQTLTKGVSMFPGEFPLMASYPTLGGSGLQSGKIENDTVSADLGNNFRWYWPVGHPLAQPAVNDVFTFHVRARDVSKANPLLIVAHPVDILTALWTQYNVDFDTTAAADAKDALASAYGDFVLALRITEPMTMRAAQEMLCGSFGLGWRFSPDGKRYLFTTRVRPASSGTITIDDLKSGDGVIWETDEASRIYSVSYKWKRFEQWPGQEDGKSVDRAVDGVMPYDHGPITFQSDVGITKPYGARDEVYEVEGTILRGSSIDNYALIDMTEFTAQLAAPVLEQFQDGGIYSTIEVGPCVAAQEGEDWLLELPHRPGFNALAVPTAQRALVERVQIIERAPQPWGAVVKFVRVPQVDGGEIPTPTPTAQTVTGKVTLTGTALSIDATATGGTSLDGTSLATTKTVAAGYDELVVAMTDTTGYAAVGAIVDIETLEQTATPSGSDSGYRWPETWDGVTPSAIRLSTFTAGATVWIRTRVRVESTGYTSAWSAWASYQVGTSDSVSSPAYGAVIPNVALAINGTDADVVVTGNEFTKKLYVVASTSGFPTRATALASSPTLATVATLPAILSGLAAGDTAYVTAVSEDTLGNRSIISTAAITVPGGGGGSDTVARALAHHALFLHRRVV